jgi:glutamyl-Q tRNA(Asp) synthetase
MLLPVYRGRFAPTPSGPLHFGSLVAAMGSFLDARAHDGEWLLRIEDIDLPRVVAGADSAILRTLEAFGFAWDGEVMYQSRRRAAYRDALEVLSQLGLVYACTCRRKHLAETSVRGVDGPVYPGRCRENTNTEGPVSLRFRVPQQRITFEDGQLGHIACDIAQECGDFVLRRADGVYTYQLGVIVDDAEQGISHVVRGADLLASTPRQIVLQKALGLQTPRYRHLPIVLGPRGEKLSKQTQASPVDAAQPLSALLEAARFLGLALPPDVETIAEFWAQARSAWLTHASMPIRGSRRAFVILDT